MGLLTDVDVNDNIILRAYQEKKDAKKKLLTKKKENLINNLKVDKTVMSQAEINELNRKSRMKNQVMVGNFLDHYITVVFMTMVTIYALYFDDLRLLFFDKVNDDYFFGFTAFGIFCFTVDIFLSLYAKRSYWNSFFFWLDVFSTLSMIPDCGWIWDLIIGGGTSNSNAYDIAKTSRAGRITRIIRVIRLIRLIRIVKLYK